MTNRKQIPVFAANRLDMLACVPPGWLSPRVAKTVGAQAVKFECVRGTWAWVVVR